MVECKFAGYPVVTTAVVTELQTPDPDVTVYLEEIEPTVIIVLESTNTSCSRLWQDQSRQGYNRPIGALSHGGLVGFRAEQ